VPGASDKQDTIPESMSQNGNEDLNSKFVPRFLLAVLEIFGISAHCMKAYERRYIRGGITLFGLLKNPPSLMLSTVPSILGE
jgi:hypothetical protein